MGDAQPVRKWLYCLIVKMIYLWGYCCHHHLSVIWDLWYVVYTRILASWNHISDICIWLSSWRSIDVNALRTKQVTFSQKIEKKRLNWTRAFLHLMRLNVEHGNFYNNDHAPLKILPMAEVFERQHHDHATPMRIIQRQHNDQSSFFILPNCQHSNT